MAAASTVVDAVVPEETQEQLNSNPYFQIGVLILIMISAAYMQFKGIKGWTEGRITDKRGNEYTGKGAKIISGVYMGVGLALEIICMVMLAKHLGLF